MKRIGPDLKMPEMKVPPFLEDLYFDLRERRLLPLVALILVAIVAVPFLLAGSSDTEAEEELVPGPQASISSSRPSSLTVVETDPGLRDYRKRLARRKPTDPFVQRYTGPVLDGSQLNAQTSTSSVTSTSTSTSTSTETSSETVTTSPPASQPGGTSPGGDGSNGTSDGLVYYAFAADIQIKRTETAKDGSKESGDPVVHEGVLPATVLPGEKAQVVTYMGISPKTQKPLFLVSTEVTAVFGEGKCVSGTGSCQLIELDPKFPETFVYGENDVRYKVTVLDVEPVVTGHS